MPELRGSHGPSPTHILTGLFGTPDLHTLPIYRKHGGYAALEKALSMAPGAIVEEVKASGLRGRGGANFATGMKWSFMAPPDGGPRYVVCNADESEPGTTKDRYLMENSPHQLLEGILIACRGIESHQAWIYIRGEYDLPYRMLTEAIAELRHAGILGPDPFGSGFALDIQVYRGHGAYICGEETALLESLEGKRAQPRPKPPFPAVKGAWGRPTLVNNVETLSTVPYIVREGAAAYAALGTERSKGTRLMSVSGHVRKPGVYEIELGTTFRDIIFGLAGGMTEGSELKCFWPGGSSQPVLLPSQLDVGSDIESVAAAGSAAGSAGCVVMGQSSCAVEVTLRLCEFYERESCGKCTPCRVGGNWSVRTLRRVLAGGSDPVDLELLDRIQASIQNGRCLCPLGDSVGAVILTMMTNFPAEFEEHVLRNECTPKGRVKEAAGA